MTELNKIICIMSIRRPCNKYGIEITDCYKIMGGDKQTVCEACLKDARSSSKRSTKANALPNNQAKVKGAKTHLKANKTLLKGIKP